MRATASVEEVHQASRLRIVLAVRHQLLLEALAQLLERAGFDVAGRCTSVPDLERCLRAHAPELAVVDADMGDDPGELIAAAGRGLAGGRLVLLSPRLDPELARTSLELAVDGVVLTRASGADLVAALHRVAAGDCVFPAGWLAAANRFSHSALDALSARQIEVLELLAQGLPNEVIAERLYISRNTVKFHVAAIYQRLGVRNRVQAAHALASLQVSA